MSAPAPPVAPRDASRSARWLDRLSVLLLVVAVAVVIGVATPAILRTAGLEIVVRGDPHAAPPVSVSPHRALPPPAPPPTARPTIPEDDSPHLTELERLYPDGMWPGQHRQDTRETPATKPQSAHTLSSVTLRQRPDPSAKVTGQVPEGVRLMMVEESGEWARVVYQSPDGLLVGWGKRVALTAP